MIILKNIKNLGKIELQWQLFLANWKFFALKILVSKNDMKLYRGATRHFEARG